MHGCVFGKSRPLAALPGLPVRYVSCFICDEPLCWWCCAYGSGCAYSPATEDSPATEEVMKSKHRLCQKCVQYHHQHHPEAASPFTWSATALDSNFMEAHQAFEDKGSLVIMAGGTGEHVNWPRLVGRLDETLVKFILAAPAEENHSITSTCVVLSMPAPMRTYLGITRSSRAHSPAAAPETEENGLLIITSSADSRSRRYFYVTLFGGMQRARQIPEAALPWNRWVLVPFTKAAIDILRDQILRG